MLIKEFLLSRQIIDPEIDVFDEASTLLNSPRKGRKKAIVGRVLDMASQQLDASKLLYLDESMRSEDIFNIIRDNAIDQDCKFLYEYYYDEKNNSHIPNPKVYYYVRVDNRNGNRSIKMIRDTVKSPKSESKQEEVVAVPISIPYSKLIISYLNKFDGTDNSDYSSLSKDEVLFRVAYMMNINPLLIKNLVKEIYHIDL
jgi:hypothetical protein